MDFAMPRAAAAGLDTFPSGSWSFGPLTIKWSVVNGDEIDVKASVLGIDVDTLTGKLTQTETSLSDTLDIMGLVAGSITMAAEFGQGPVKDGLWIRGRLKAGTWDTGDLNHRIVAW